MNLPIGTLLQNGHYQVKSILGQGSFGITYLATVNLIGSLGSIPTGSKVAIKEFFMQDVNGRKGKTVTVGSKNGLFHNYKRRFLKEAYTLSKLSHPNIVRVLDLFEENNTAYYVMEFLDGGNLDKLIASKSGLSVTECDQIIRQIGSALQYMHANNMLHLDLKPANVMLNSNGNAILIDFGLTKQFDENGNPESSTTIGHGTPGYAPIEQNNYQSGQGFPVTMDVYAMGATLYKMLTGVRPPSASEILNYGLSSVELRKHNCSNEVISFIKAAMEPLKLRRIQSVAEFISELPFERSFEEEIETEDNSISIFIKMDNEVVILYFHGHIYKDLKGHFLSLLSGISTIDNLKSIFSQSFIKVSQMDFETFIEEYGELMKNCKISLVSYFSIDDYFRIIKALNTTKIDKIFRESSLISFYLTTFQNVSDKDKTHTLFYREGKFTFENGGQICEITEDLDDFKQRECNAFFGHKYIIKNDYNLKMSLLGGFVKELYVSEHNSDSLLLDIIPFDVRFGPKWGSVVPILINKGETLPTRKSENFDFVGSDYIGIQIANRECLFEPAKVMRTIPKYIECSAESGYLFQNIIFRIKNKETGEIKSYKIQDLDFHLIETNKSKEQSERTMLR